MQTFPITITIKPKFYELKPINQLNNAVAELDSFSDKLDMAIVAELTDSFNIHFHGVIRCKEKPKRGSQRGFIHDVFRKASMLGFIDLGTRYCKKQQIEYDDFLKEFDTVHAEKWYKYCMKQYTETAQELGGKIYFNDILRIPIDQPRILEENTARTAGLDNEGVETVVHIQDSVKVPKKILVKVKQIHRGSKGYKPNINAICDYPDDI